MRTMKYFMLLVTMLLNSVGAFAQSNNTPLLGDVNGDGKVDVADIVAILKIMKDAGGTAEEPTYYWYVGTTKPTSLSEASIVESYPAEQTFTNPSTTEKCYVYVLVNSDKTVNFYDPADPSDELYKAEDTTSISGYKIATISGDGINPQKIARGGSLIIKIS